MGDVDVSCQRGDEKWKISIQVKYNAPLSSTTKGHGFSAASDMAWDMLNAYFHLERHKGMSIFSSAIDDSSKK